MSAVTWPDAFFAIFLGTLISLFFGSIFVPAFHAWTKANADRQAGHEPNPLLNAGINSHITGLLERGIFTILFVFLPGAAIPGIAGYLTLKIAAHWGRKAPIENEMQWIAHGFLSLQTGVVSMLFAVAGGLVARWALGFPWPVPAGFPVYWSAE